MIGCDWNFNKMIDFYFSTKFVVLKKENLVGETNI